MCYLTFVLLRDYVSSDLFMGRVSRACIRSNRRFNLTVRALYSAFEISSDVSFTKVAISQLLPAISCICSHQMHVLSTALHSFLTQSWISRSITVTSRSVSLLKKIQSPVPLISPNGVRRTHLPFLVHPEPSHFPAKKPSTRILLEATIPLHLQNGICQHSVSNLRKDLTLKTHLPNLPLPPSPSLLASSAPNPFPQTTHPSPAPNLSASPQHSKQTLLLR